MMGTGSAAGSEQAAERVAIDQEARMLVADLHKIHGTLKPGSIEREQREDYIYKRLYQLAETIKARHPRDPKLQEIYFAITNDGAPQESVTVRRLPVYTDEYKMFTQSPTTPKVQLFLEKMATDLKSLPEDETRRLLSDQTIDGPKEVLRSFVSKCHRERWLKESAEITCHGCWDEVMHFVFMMSVEMLTLELKQRSKQIRLMTEKGYLAEVDAMDLIQHIEKIIRETDRMIAKAEKPKKSKREWIELIESLFRLLVGLVNDLMMRYVKFMAFRKENQL